MNTNDPEPNDYLTHKLNCDDKIEGKIVTVYVATCNEDLREGKGKTIDSGYYPTENEASMGAAGISTQGADGGIEPRTMLRLNDGRHFPIELKPIKLENISKEQREALVKQAKSKLSPAELVALGIRP
jgi:hypothetical protein